MYPFYLLLSLISILLIGAAIFISRNFKAIKLEHIKFYPDEIIVTEEYPIKCKIDGDNTESSTRFPNSKSIITNYRIMLAQKHLLSKSFMVRYIINYRVKEDEDVNNEMTRKHYNYMIISSKNVSFEEIKNTRWIHVKVTENNILSTFSSTILSFSTNYTEKIKECLATNVKDIQD